MFKKEKYTCCFCSNKKEKSKSKIHFCRDCERIRNYIREYGLKNLLEFIENKNNNPSCPPY